MDDYGSTEFDCGKCGNRGGPDGLVCPACGMPPQGGYQVGDVYVHPDGGCTPKPVELIRRELAEEEHAHDLWQLDRSTWPDGDPHADVTTWTDELETP